MSNFRVWVLSVRRNILPGVFVVFAVCLLVFSGNNLASAKNGLLLWANSVVPALFPFFVATELLKSTCVVDYLGRLLNRVMRPVFNVPGVGAFAFIMGIISGYPVGAKIASELYKDGLCSKAEAERLLSFTNNSGPLFIIGTVGITLFGNTSIGFLLFGVHVVSSILVGFLFRFWKRNDVETISSKNNFYTKSNSSNVSNLGELLSNSIMNAVHSVVLIGGFVVLFCVIISILNTSGFLDVCAGLITPIFEFLHIETSFIKPFLSGIIELTNGLNSLTSIHTKYISVSFILASFLLGFGGFSVLLQVFSIISKFHLSIKPYILAKLLHGFLASILTCLSINIFPIFNLDFAPVFSQNVDLVSNLSSSVNYSSVLFVICIIVISTFLFKKKKYCKH